MLEVAEEPLLQRNLRLQNSLVRRHAASMLNLRLRHGGGRMGRVEGVDAGLAQEECLYHARVAM